MPDIIHKVGIQAAPKKVFEAVSTLEGYRGWWGPDAVGNPQKGGVITFFNHVDMKVLEFKPNEKVKWLCVRGPEEWMKTEVTFELKRKQGLTFVLFTHAKWKKPVEFMRHCSTKWAVYLLSLKDLVEKGKGRPSPHDIKIHGGD
jgi:uncharacterized protein YndB with AHSA1/START domain